jgi:hypothetical protein
MLKAGWDCFTPDAGTEDSIVCPTCRHPMSVNRDCKGPRGWAANMAARMNVGLPDKEYAPYDFFSCAAAEDERHQTARDLLGLSQDTPSPTLSAIYAGDAEKILHEANFSYNEECISQNIEKRTDQ